MLQERSEGEVGADLLSIGKELVERLLVPVEQLGEFVEAPEEQGGDQQRRPIGAGAREVVAEVTVFEDEGTGGEDGGGSEHGQLGAFGRLDEIMVTGQAVVEHAQPSGSRRDFPSMRMVVQ
jgi:hypothetical protein